MDTNKHEVGAEETTTDYTDDTDRRLAQPNARYCVEIQKSSAHDIRYSGGLFYLPIL